MSNLSIKTLGAFQVTMAGETITDFRTRKVQALLVYLATEPIPHNRNRLLDLLWPGLPERSARSNLRQILYYLRQDIPDGFGRNGQDGPSLTIANRQDIQLNPLAGVEVDSGRFENLLNETRNHNHVDLFICQECRQHLEQAVDLYRGDFLSDFFLDDSNIFEEWAQSRREYFRRHALDSLAILTTIYTRQRDYPQAQKSAERQLEIDNLSEGAYRQLMEILALNGRREQALAVYSACRRILAEELGMAPSTRTEKLYEKILDGDLNFDGNQQENIRGYELKEMIAEGGHGAVHRAIQPVIGRQVAVKVIRRQHADDPDFIRRFEAEAQIVARLEHPHIVPLYDYWRDPNGAYLVMRYMRHGSLLSALEGGPWTLPQTGVLLNQIAGALSVAHRKGIVHRDIKPGNILLDDSGNAYLTDFGIAKDFVRQEQLTSENVVIGTLDYTSPEQILSGEVTPQSDIYSLGAVIYETLTGEKPFADDSIANLLYNQLNTHMPLVTATRPDIPAAVDTVLQKATAKKAAERYATTQEMAAAFTQAVGGLELAKSSEAASLLVPEISKIYNPYKGLRAFQEADADDFFGRDNLVQQLVDRLGDSGSRFLAIVGPSGSGKSSVVKAGLIPALRSGALPGSKNWFTAEMVPGSHPLEELELALWPIAVDPPPSLVEPMQRDTRGLLRTIRRILPDGNGSVQPQLLLIIDQFEELYTLVEDEEHRAFFLDSLLAALQAPRSPLRVIVTLRADFYDRPLLHQEWGQIIKDNTEIVLPLNHSELTWAVREPARRMGVRLEEELVTTIVGDVADQMGALPLLQFALTELFERRDGNMITRTAYHQIGGVQGALGRRAEAIYESLDEKGKEATRQLFLRLITLGEGIEDTRRRVHRSEATGLAGSGQAMEEVLDDFGTARLLTFDRDPSNRAPTVEVAHEALLREWPRLRRWLEQSRDDVRLQRLLAQAAGEWVKAEKDDAYLLRGSRLDQFGNWVEGTQLALTQDEKDFLAASLTARTARQEEEEARRQRELEAARQLAETEQARAFEQALASGRLRQRAMLLGGALIVAVLLAIASFNSAEQADQNAITAQENADLAAASAAEAVSESSQRATAQAFAEAESQRANEERDAAINAQATAVAEGIRADEQREIAEQKREAAIEQANLAQSRELALNALNSLDFDPELGILLAMEAISKANTIEASSALHQTVASSRVRMRLPVGGFVTDVTYSPEGTYIAAVTDEILSVKVWEAEAGQEIFQVPIIHDWPPNAEIKLSETQIAIVNIEETMTLTIWDFRSGQQNSSTVIPVFTENLTDYDLSPDWQKLAIGHADGSAEVWDVNSGRQLFDLPGHTDQVLLAYSQNGLRLATVGSDGNARVWDVNSGNELYSINIGPIMGDQSGEYLSPDGKLLAISMLDGPVYIWNLEDIAITPDAQPMTKLVGHTNPIFGFAFSPDGQMIATGARDQTARVWNPFTGEELITLHHGVNVWPVAFNNDESQLLTGDWDESVRIWDITPQGEAELFTFSINEVIRDISPGGEFLVTTSANKATIWDATTGEALFVLDEHTDNVRDAEFSPDGRLLVTASLDKTAILWDVASGERLFTLVGHGEGFLAGVVPGVIAATFSPDGTQVATAGADKTARIWDTNTGEELQVLTGHTYGLTNVAFSPDGNILATSSEEDDAIVKIWDVGAGTELFSLPPSHFDRVNGLVFSPDGRLLATSGGDATAKVWYLDLEARAGYLLTTLVGHQSTVGGLAISPDGQFLATSSAAEFKVWDISGLYNVDPQNMTGIVSVPQLLSLPGNAGVVFHPRINGTLFVGDRFANVIRGYTLSIEELMAIAASRITRSLTDAECQQYLHLNACPP